MVEPVPARSTKQRIADSLYHFENDVDLLIASANLNADPTLVPLNFCWISDSFLIATVITNPTACNMNDHGKVRLMVGHSRDVVLIDATATKLEHDKVDQRWRSVFVTKHNWDPSESSMYGFYQLIPHGIQAWRELNEHSDRFIMRNGQWLS